ncbi:MAG: PqqD family protein [Cyanobacteria bacterium P01_G01_bin.39]
MIEETSIVVTAKEKRYSNLNQDVVILDLKSEEYYGLNHVGGTVWHALQEPKSVSEIREIILSKYDVEAEKCDRDLKVFLEKLETQKLIEVRN